MTIKKRKTRATTSGAKKVTPTPEPSNRVSNYAIPIGLLWVLISLAIGLGIVFITLSDKLDSLEQKITGQNNELLEKQNLLEEKKLEEDKQKLEISSSTENILEDSKVIDESNK